MRKACFEDPARAFENKCSKLNLDELKSVDYSEYKEGAADDVAPSSHSHYESSIFFVNNVLLKGGDFSLVR